MKNQNAYKTAYTAAQETFDTSAAEMKKYLDSNETYQAACEIVGDPLVDDDLPELKLAAETLQAIEIAASERYQREHHREQLAKARRELITVYLERVKKLPGCPKELLDYLAPDQLDERLFTKTANRVIEIALQDGSW
jgi:histidyl-tRNA synthetase